MYTPNIQSIQSATSGTVDTRKQPDASLQPIIEGLNLSATKLYRTSSSGEVNSAHSAIIDAGSKKCEDAGTSECVLTIKGNTFTFRLYGADTNTISASDIS